jgi:hypothetical protein
MLKRGDVLEWVLRGLRVLQDKSFHVQSEDLVASELKKVHHHHVDCGDDEKSRIDAHLAKEQEMRMRRLKVSREQRMWD